MKYESKKYPDATTVTLQSVGHVVGEPAENVKKGDFLMWNFGAKEEVVEILNETKCFVTIRIKSCRSTFEGSRTLKKIGLFVS